MKPSTYLPLACASATLLTTVNAVPILLPHECVECAQDDADTTVFSPRPQVASPESDNYPVYLSGKARSHDSWTQHLTASVRAAFPGTRHTDVIDLSSTTAVVVELEDEISETELLIDHDHTEADADAPMEAIYSTRSTLQQPLADPHTLDTNTHSAEYIDAEIMLLATTSDHHTTSASQPKKLSANHLSAPTPVPAPIAPEDRHTAAETKEHREKQLQMLTSSDSDEASHGTFLRLLPGRKLDQISPYATINRVPHYPSSSSPHSDSHSPSQPSSTSKSQSYLTSSTSKSKTHGKTTDFVLLTSLTSHIPSLLHKLLSQLTIALSLSFKWLDTKILTPLFSIGLVPLLILQFGIAVLVVEIWDLSVRGLRLRRKREEREGKIRLGEEVRVGDLAGREELEDEKEMEEV